MTRSPEINCETRKAGRSERGRLGHCGTNYRDAENIALKLHQRVVGGGASVNPQFLHWAASVAAHGIEQIGDLVGNAFHRRPRQVAGGSSARQAKD